MFQFRRFPPYAYGFSVWYTDITPCGFPHSDICGSKPVCGSPQLFAAYHVLRRLPVPRHSPCALFRLTSFALSRFTLLAAGSALRAYYVSIFEIIEIVINSPIVCYWDNNSFISCLLLLASVFSSQGAIAGCAGRKGHMGKLVSP